MTLEITTNRYGARPVRTYQAGAVPGSLSRRSPSNATGGTFVSSCGVIERTRRASGKKIHQAKVERTTIHQHYALNYNRSIVLDLTKEINYSISYMKTKLTSAVLRRETIEYWQDEHHLILVNDPTDKPTFYSRRWHTTTTPDLAFCTDDIHQNISRKICEQLGGSDHCPVILFIRGTNTPANALLPRWNYKKRIQQKWNLTKALNDDGSKGQNITLEVEGRTTTGKAAANAFVKGYEAKSNSNIPTLRKKEVVEDAFQFKKETLAVFVDLQRAFDKVWKDGLLAKMLRYGISGRMYKWTKCYWYNRRSRVLVDGKCGQKVLLKQGVSQTEDRTQQTQPTSTQSHESCSISNVSLRRSRAGYGTPVTVMQYPPGIER
ncbi:unnamed protein product [Mytilus edulis]|uniref:Reverse transcriptase domain-containing protein n=1 Tax=Mytilus edulis TaxID=6550 RepID=A0A8S3UTL2_MYTED|nr:unnamed protein product [Mytilus edulis]